MCVEPIHPQLLVGPGERDLAALVQADLLEPAGPEAASLRIVLLPRAPGGGSPRERLGRMVGRLHAAAASAPEHGALAFVQFGGGPFSTPATPADPETCSATAFAASLHLERPGLRVRVLDCHPALSSPALVAALSRELAGSEPFIAAGYDEAGRRLVPRMVLLPTTPRAAPVEAGPVERVLLVTGGAKGITAECVLALSCAESTPISGRSRFALVGTSPGDDPQVQRSLERFAAAGHEARYYPCDLCDAEAVRALAVQVRAELGPVTDLIHGAAINRPRRLDRTTSEEALAEVGPKLLGAWHLLDALADHPLCRLVALTSIIGVTGMAGNAWYGFANEALDLVVRRFGAEHGKAQALSVAFSVWGETGMGARLGKVEHLARLGIVPIPTAEGVRQFVDLVQGGVRGQVVVAARLGGRATAWPAELPPQPSGLRFVERVAHTCPPAELTARCRLSVSRDPYLLDHDFQGSLLFPTVFGLEAMAQAVAALTGEEQPIVVRLEDIRLERPIVVDREAGAEIEVHVVAGQPSGGERSFRVAIRTEQTGLAIDHFAATLVLGEPLEAEKVAVPEGPPLPLDPATDVYGPLLFQGPRFQRMREVYELSGDHTIFAAEEQGRSHVESAFGPGGEYRLLLGDPFLRDVLLQAGQLTIPQEVCLPVAIARIELFRCVGDQPADQRRLVFAPFKVRDGREYTAEVFTTDASGRVLERLSGYRLRILGERPDRPTAADLANPAERDQRLLEAALRSALPAGHPLPTALLMPAQLHGRTRPERRAGVEPLVQQAVRRHWGEEAGATVAWRPDNKPFFDGPPPGEGAEVSIAHDDRYALCLVGTGPQGCDLTPMTPRSRDEWPELLGPHRAALLDELIGAGDRPVVAGARLWAAVEAVRKATQSEQVSLTLAGCQGDGVRLRADQLPDTTVVLTVPVRLTYGPERLVAVTLTAATAGTAVAPVQPAEAPAAPMTSERGIPALWHSVSVADDGPQGQPVQELRFLVSFQEASTLGRRVPASRYLSWMGRMRELVTSAALPQLVTHIAGGEWGLVTNWADVRVCGEATANDVVQMRFWTDAPGQCEVAFYCDFWKLADGAPPVRLAFAAQKATWVRLLGHGQVAPEPLPGYLAAFIASMGPRPEFVRPERAMPEALADLRERLGLSQAAPSPASDREVARETVQTSLEESNLVGNVYFANYFAWQNRVRDLYLRRAAPRRFHGIGTDGELICLHSRVDYLREAMPFDRIEVRLAPRSVAACGTVLDFEYYRVGPGGERQKLSVGSQEAAWVRRRADGTPEPEPWPADLLATWRGERVT
jgi:NAD(P)-dependent dehydrogenase (short-subunit alcohol dehydrogenase family)/acyl-CoA thioesterase FadM